MYLSLVPQINKKNTVSGLNKIISIKIRKLPFFIFHKINLIHSIQTIPK